MTLNKASLDPDNPWEGYCRSRLSYFLHFISFLEDGRALDPSKTHLCYPVNGGLPTVYAAVFISTSVGLSLRHIVIIGTGYYATTIIVALTLDLTSL